MLLSGKKRHPILSTPVRMISVSFLLVVITGTLLLTLPICNRQGVWTPFTDALFTATSATCVTGLVIFDTYTYWNVLGQGVILLLIQIGGLGLVTFTTFFNITIGKKLGLRHMQIAQESVSSESLVDTTRLIKMIIILSLTFELAGALVLSTVFIPEFGAEGIFTSIFLAISAYCNAGFDILGSKGAFSSLTTYSDNPVVLYTIMGLIICGGLGFIVWKDLYNFRKTKKLMLHTKIVLLITIALIFGGALLYLFNEWHNPGTLGPMSPGDKINNALFMSVTTRTAGFNSVDIASLSEPSMLTSVFLMFIGAAPGSTGGGIKVTTLAVILMTVYSVVRGKSDTMILGRRVSQPVVYKSLAVVMIAALAVLCSTVTIVFTTGPDVEVGGMDALFESVSAFATVGLSCGVTAVANVASRMLLSLTMFIGRVGPVSLALALAMIPNKNRNQVVPEGKIMVG